MAVSFLRASVIGLICLNAIGATAAPAVTCVDDFPRANVAINGDFEASILGSIAPWSAVTTSTYSGVFIKDLYQCNGQRCYYASPFVGSYAGSEVLSLEMATVEGHTYDLTGQTMGVNNNCTVKFVVGDSLAKGKVIATKNQLNAETLSSFTDVTGSYKATRTKTKLWIEVKCVFWGSTRRGVVIDDIKFVDRGRSKVCPIPTITTNPPATTTAVPPPKATGCNEWEDLGCYPIYSGNARRVSIDAAMTNEKCWAACSSEGYTYAGTYFGTECYCGLSLNDWGYTSDLDPLVNTDRFCTLKCPGNSNQLCGSNRAWNMYHKSTTKCAPPRPTSECPPTSTKRSTSTTSPPSTTSSTFTKSSTSTASPTFTKSSTSTASPTFTKSSISTMSPTTTGAASPMPTKVATMPFQWAPKKFFYWQ